MKRLFMVLVLGSFVAFLSPTYAGLSEAILGANSETEPLIQNLSGGVTTIKSPGAVVAGVVQIVLGLLGVVGVIIVMYAGFLWLTAAGEEEKAKQGRTLLFQAIIGTLIVLAAYTLTFFVLKELAKAVAG